MIVSRFKYSQKLPYLLRFLNKQTSHFQTFLASLCFSAKWQDPTHFLEMQRSRSGNDLPMKCSFTLTTDSLAVQHNFLTQLLGFIIHPSISTPLTNPSLHIADIAAGTGVFLLDVAKHVPATAQLHGFDISDAQFPAPDKRPRNLQLHVHDMREPFPEQFGGNFDVVCVRLVVAGLMDDDWDKAVENIAKLLSESEPHLKTLQVQ